MLYQGTNWFCPECRSGRVALFHEAQSDEPWVALEEPPTWWVCADCGYTDAPEWVELSAVPSIPVPSSVPIWVEEDPWPTHNVACEHCKGVGSISIGGEAIGCRQCNGLGYRTTFGKLPTG